RSQHSRTKQEQPRGTVVAVPLRKPAAPSMARQARTAKEADQRPNRVSRSTAMLKLIEGSYASFSDRLGWDVVVNNGYERDRFDDINPLYLVSVDPDTERYWGLLRVLPTT